MAGVGAPSKPAVPLAGRPLVSYPLAVLDAVCSRVAVVCKADTSLPELSGVVERWIEPQRPRHPIVGLVEALERAGAAVLVCAADMPFVTVEAARELLAAAERQPAAATVAATAGGLEPLFGLYEPTALDGLRAAPADAPLRATVEALRPARVDLPPELVRSVNDPDDLAAAERELAGRSAAR